MTSYYLSPTTFICLADNQLVFLDLHEDKYLGIDRKNTKKLQSLFQKKALSKQCLNEKEDFYNDCELVASTLVDQGLLTLDKASGKTLAMTSIALPDSEICGYNTMADQKVSVRQLFAVFRATLTAKLKLRFFSLETIAQQVSKRKQQTSADTSLTSLQVGELVSGFKRFRPLFFTANNHCLFDALALIEYLAAYNIYPDWVFGVRMGPFRAHCWIQNDKAIFNDSVANVASYTPILKL